MDKYSFISNSGIKKKRKRKKNKKIEINKIDRIEFTIKVPSLVYVSERRKSLKKRIEEIIDNLKKLKRTPKNSVFLCNSGTIGFLRTYYNYPGSPSNVVPLCDYEIVINESIVNNLLVSGYKDE